MRNGRIQGELVHGEKREMRGIIVDLLLTCWRCGFTEHMVAVTCSFTMARMWAMSTLVESIGVVEEDPEGPGTETSR